MPCPCRLLLDSPSRGAWNMAVDEALLEHAATGGRSLWLRFYEWDQPTLSLGYFQPHSLWRKHVPSDCAVVRRRTGGGAILHDRELTYSLVLPPQHPLSRRPEELYDLVHGALIAALGRFGITAELHGKSQPRSRDEEPYLCFLRRAAADVVVRPCASEPKCSDPPAADTKQAPLANVYKICGSAQRRSLGAVLLHGSLLLDTSPAAPQLPGLRELTGKSLTIRDARTAWSDELQGRLGLDSLHARELPPQIHERSRWFEQSRFATSAWTARR